MFINETKIIETIEPEKSVNISLMPASLKGTNIWWVSSRTAVIKDINKIKNIFLFILSPEVIKKRKKVNRLPNECHPEIVSGSVRIC